MTISIDFKIYLDTEKNSEIIGRWLAACCLKITETSGFILAKNGVLVDQSTKWICKMRVFLATIPYYYKKIFQIIQRFQKQTP